MILTEERDKKQRKYHVDGKRVKWLIKTDMREHGGPITLKYKLEGLSGTYERQFSSIEVKEESKTSTTWELIDELPSADWAWDKQKARLVLI